MGIGGVGGICWGVKGGWGGGGGAALPVTCLRGSVISCRSINLFVVLKSWADLCLSWRCRNSSWMRVDSGDVGECLV